MRARRPAWILPFLVAIACVLPAALAGAHGRSVSYSRWDLGELRVQVRVSLLELTRLDIRPDTPTQRTAGYLAAHLALLTDAGTCVPRGKAVTRPASEGWLSLAWRLDCAGQAPSAIESRILLDVAPSHLHFARVRHADGRFVERVLTEAEPRWSVAPGDVSTNETGGTSLFGYVKLGVEHILSGWDHLAFVLALLLLAGTLGEVASLVTAFTIAHSVTLGLAALGILHPNVAAVEAMIGFSIALVAAENAWLLGGRNRQVPLWVAALPLSFAAFAGLGLIEASPLAFLGLALFSLCHFGMLRRAEKPARLRAAVAFAFGLVHGFGFAGVLGEMQLDSSRLLSALFGFNAGVELGQLAVVCAIWPLLRALARRAEGWHRGIAELGSAAICGLGVFWFVTRTLA